MSNEFIKVRYSPTQGLIEELSDVGDIDLANGLLRVGQSRHVTRSITANVTIVNSDFFINVDATSGQATVTLSSAANDPGRIVHVKKIDATGNAVVVMPVLGQTIDGATSKMITDQYVTLSIISHDDAWWII